MKQLKTFEIRMEALVPCSLIYRIRAETAEDALKVVDKHNPSNVRNHIRQKRSLKAVVYEAGSSVIKLVKSFR